MTDFQIGSFNDNISKESLEIVYYKTWYEWCISQHNISTFTVLITIGNT